jgi:glycerol-3-phosphate dehydrogenase
LTTPGWHWRWLLNYCPATGLIHSAGKVTGVRCRDGETGQDYEIRAGCVINATGVWVDRLRQQDGQAIGHPVEAMVAPSQGVHIVVDREFLPGNHALMVPKTADGRVLFGVPWLGKLILGTTDTPRGDLAREPRPFQEELDFILSESARYLARGPVATDIRSMWVGLRPLVRPQDDNGQDTKKISREHTVLASASGLITVTGGKWTTYRAMAEDVLDLCFEEKLLKRVEGGVTTHLTLNGGDRGAGPARPLSEPQGWHSYGSEEAQVRSLPGAENLLGGGLTEAMVRFAARSEYARTVEDVLARRWRTLFLDARLAGSMAAAVGRILEQETGVDPAVADFGALARLYLTVPSDEAS